MDGEPTGPRFAAESAYRTLAARRQGRLEALASEIETDHEFETLVLPRGVTAEVEVEKAFERTVETFEPGEVTEPVEVAEAIRQRPPNVTSSIDLYRREEMGHF